MNEKQMLYENYEDAFFAIIINEATELDGKRLLEENEQLKRDPTAEISDSFRKRCLDTINKGIKGNKRKATKGTAKKIIRLLPLVAIVAIFLTAIAYAAIPSFRTDVLNLLLEISTEYASWNVTPSDGEIAQNNSSYPITVPEGFVLDSHSKTTYNEIYCYTDSSDNYIQITILEAPDTSINTDLEDCDYFEEFYLNDTRCILTVKSETINITFYDPYSVQVFNVLTNASFGINEAKELALTIYANDK